ncbi:hypothetical protein Q5741_13825 [Paenibacillus sp. JX-17]|uniref:Uncharacterized protein n=1 Tax=Paenibacillus lacisoli TaxID=3064525 RepID=A0ABT9CDZ5_9BACL|nr:hypothetical protein [Paenibacillus sp. JX-17]MDO7907485.1 hypothetical protein [Paenibacillus sp. JX-17]
MQIIYPLNQDTCKAHIGKRVCVMLQDGAQLSGILSGVSDKGLDFNGKVESIRAVAKPAKKAEPKNGAKSGKKAKAAAVQSPQAAVPTKESGAVQGRGLTPGVDYPYPFALAWSSVAFLFLLA